MQQCRDCRLSQFQRFALVFEWDTKLIEPSFCIVQETLITNRHPKFQHFCLRQYRDPHLSVGPLIRARIRVRYETDGAQLLRRPRDIIANHPEKFQRFWFRQYRDMKLPFSSSCEHEIFYTLFSMFFLHSESNQTPDWYRTRFVTLFLCGVINSERHRI